MNKYGIVSKQNLMIFLKILSVALLIIQTIVAPFYPIFGTPINIVIVGLAFIATLIVVFDKSIFKCKFFLWVLPFFVSVCISIVLNYQLNFVDNVQVAIILFVNLFIFFLGYDTDKTKLKNNIFKFSNYTGVAVLVTSIIGFLMYAANKFLWLYSYRYSGLFTNPNIASLVTSVGVITSLIALSMINVNKNEIKGHKYLKVVHIANVILSFFMNVIANSNTGKISLCMLIVVVTFFMLYGMKTKKGKKVSVILSGIISIVMVVVLIATMTVTLKVAEYIPYLSENISLIFDESIDHTDSDNDSDSDKRHPEKTNLNREESDIPADNGRFSIWKQGISSLNNDMMFGCAPRNIYNAVVEEYGDDAIPAIAGGGLHNMFVEILATTGVVGFATFMIFVLRVFLYIAKYFFVDKCNVEDRKMLVFMLGAVCMLFVTNFTESVIVFSVNMYSMAFWIILGFLVNYIMLDEKERKYKNEL